MSKQIPDDLIHAAFFFIDIVGLSNPILSTETQRTKIKILNDNIYSCQTLRSTPKKDLFVLPTGDGMLIGFKDALEQPIKLAMELHEKLRNYNLNVPSTEKITTRIGCNIGNIFVVKDLFGNVNLWGPGAILARRVMDLGDENHILLTASMADDLIELSDEYSKILHPIYDYGIKHNEEILVYNAYGQNFGNQHPPKKGIEKSNTSDALNVEKNTKCEKIIFNMRVNNLITSLLKHERVYYFVNNSIEPIYDINVGIITKPEKKLQDLNVKVFDEHEELKITRVSSLSPFIKELTVKLKRPVFNGDSNRLVKVYYEAEEPYKYFENLFLTDTVNFELNFSFPYDAPNMAPKLYYVDLKNNNEKLLDELKRSVKGMSTTIQWQKDDGIYLKNMIRLEW
ncbi:hypothetical protein C4565_11025 [Candidatus Parcubacteria bacterium]|nr:MAG: hypothetical protein C4565_11025 [Candidatus Parcubacteria bacterium]